MPKPHPPVPSRPTAPGRGEDLLVAPSPRAPAFPVRTEVVTAILVDGGFYRKRAARLFGHKDPEARADELLEYCRRHTRKTRSRLYRIFYYDCPPSEKVVYHPLTQKSVNLAKTDDYRWMTDFHAALLKKRKVALRQGETLETQSGYQIKAQPLKKLLRGEISVADLEADDFLLDITQKGVDMRVGLDIAALAATEPVNQIIMISGDSDFVPAAKHARRSGIDFVLDPMWAQITDSLHEHIDGLWQCVRPNPDNLRDPLHADNLSSASVAAKDDEDADVDL